MQIYAWQDDEYGDSKQREWSSRLAASLTKDNDDDDEEEEAILNYSAPVQDYQVWGRLVGNYKWVMQNVENF